MKHELSEKLQALRIERLAIPERRAPALMLLLALATLALTGLVYASHVATWPGARRKVQLSSVAMVDAGAYTARLSATGFVTAEDAASISPTAAGVVSFVAVIEGAMVRQGDVVYALDPRQAGARVAGARAQLTAAEADVETAQTALVQAIALAARTRAMVERDVLPRNQAADAEANVIQLERQLTAAAARSQIVRAGVAAAELELKLTRIHAPSSGIVVGQLPSLGEYVAPGYEAMRPRVVDPSKLRVVLDIPEGRAHLVDLGSPCQIVLEAWPDVTLHGELQRFGAEINRAKGTVQAWLTFDTGDAVVLPGTSARVQFLDAERAKRKEKTLAKVPKNALRRRQGAAGVFVVEDGRARWREVVVDSESNNETLLRSGVGPGDQVIQQPDDALKSGERVKGE